MSARTLHHSLLRPAILQILRAAGFHAAKPSVVDTLTDIAARYIFLLADRTVSHANLNHQDSTPDITDVRMALLDCGLLTPSRTASEEVWKEVLRPPILEIPERNGLRQMEMRRRDAEDTHEIRVFMDWFHGPAHGEILRVAGLSQDQSQIPPLDGMELEKPEDYLTALKKKHSKTGEDVRFQGTILGKDSEARPVKIDGGPESLQQWHSQMREKSSKLNTVRNGNGFTTPGSSEEDEDADMVG